MEKEIPKSKMVLKFFHLKSCFFALILVFSILPPSLTFAAMKSNDYQIQMPNLNFFPGAIEKNGDNPGLTPRETAIDLYSSTGYRVRAGFWYIKKIIPFAFSLTPVALDFKNPTSNAPITNNLTLTVSAGGTGGYQVTVQENRPLTSTAGNTIPDTTCDAGNCDEITAAAWSSNTTYGLGYTLFGDDVPTPFSTTGLAKNQYKQFSNRLLNESPEPVMSSFRVDKNRSATLSLKINLSGIQAAGSYQNQLIFVATPRY